MWNWNFIARAFVCVCYGFWCQFYVFLKWNEHDVWFDFSWKFFFSYYYFILFSCFFFSRCNLKSNNRSRKMICERKWNWKIFVWLKLSLVWWWLRWLFAFEHKNVNQFFMLQNKLLLVLYFACTSVQGG